jgi:simple sugar transport system permease protein
MASGAAYAAIPGLLKARFGAHEVINTIMLNFVAAALVNYWGHAAFVRETVRTVSLPAAAMLPRLDALWPALRGSPVNASLLLAIAAGVAVGVLLWRTAFGYELRATGLNPAAAEYGGVRVPGVWVKAMALSGALAGLVGANFVLGYKGYFESGFTAGVGFLGIAVALLGRTHPAGVAVAALFFGALSHGGLVINQLVPKELVEILQGIVILVAIVAHELLERWLKRRS